MRRIPIILILILTLAGCTPEEIIISAADQLKEFHEVSTASAQPLPASNDTIKIASFNIKWLSHKKAGDPVKGKIITDTISQFDIVAIQEIRDSSDKTMNILESALAELGKDYDWVIGPLLPTDSTYKERYAFIYNTATIEKGSDGFTYSDPDNDFVREPFMIHFKTKNGNLDFVMVSIHTKPANTDQEIGDLPDVIAEAIQTFNEPDIITCEDKCQVN